MSLSADQQKVLWSEQSASISRLIARVESLEQSLAQAEIRALDAQERVGVVEGLLKEMNAEMMGEVP